jgi:hypothetical protein
MEAGVGRALQGLTLVSVSSFLLTGSKGCHMVENLILLPAQKGRRIGCQ